MIGYRHRVRNLTLSTKRIKKQEGARKGLGSRPVAGKSFEDPSRRQTLYLSIFLEGVVGCQTEQVIDKSPKGLLRAAIDF